MRRPQAQRRSCLTLARQCERACNPADRSLLPPSPASPCPRKRAFFAQKSFLTAVRMAAFSAACGSLALEDLQRRLADGSMLGLCRPPLHFSQKDPWREYRLLLHYAEQPASVIRFLSPADKEASIENSELQLTGAKVLPSKEFKGII